MTCTKYVFIQNSKGIFVFLLMTKHYGRHKLLLFVFYLPYACNYKTPRAPWATYCSFSSSLLLPKSDVSADMFIARVVREPSIHSTLCSSCLFDCVMLRFHLRARWEKTVITQTGFWQLVRRTDVSLHKDSSCKWAGVMT